MWLSRDVMWDDFSEPRPVRLFLKRDLSKLQYTFCMAISDVERHTGPVSEWSPYKFTYSMRCNDVGVCNQCFNDLLTEGT